MKGKLMTLAACALVAAAAFSLLVSAGCSQGKPTALILATTTSVQDSGLLNKLLPTFDKQYNHKTKAIAVGSGEAIEMGEKGNADVVMAHSPAQEEAFVKAGFGFERVQVMYNYFVIIGPASDPAAIKGDKSAVDTFKRIAAAGEAGKAIFVSRGDASGTNTAELDFWKKAGIAPQGKPWYVVTGQGMGPTLTITNQKQAYTLTDKATYVTMEGTINLPILVQGDPALINLYSVEVVNPAKFPHLKINTKGAEDFVQFLTSKQGQAMIGADKVKGFVLFQPDAKGETRGTGNQKQQ